MEYGNTKFVLLYLFIHIDIVFIVYCNFEQNIPFIVRKVRKDGLFLKMLHIFMTSGKTNSMACHSSLCAPCCSVARKNLARRLATRGPRIQRPFFSKNLGFS